MTRRQVKPEPKQELTMAEAAAVLGCSRDAARKMLQRLGKAYRIKGRWFARLYDVEQLLRKERSFSTTEIANVLGMTVSGARKRLRRTGAGRKIRGRWSTNVSQLVAGSSALFLDRFSEDARGFGD